MKISVVIPTRHRNDLLARCLDRLAPGAQSLAADQYEVIVSDDGAETTAERLVAERYAWVRWVAGPRLGPAANRNNGARLASGNWLAFTDDDCVPETNWLGAYRDAIQEQVDVFEGRTTCRAGVRSPREIAPINLTGGWLWSCNMMVRKSAFEQLGGFDEDFPYPHMEDVDFRRRLQARQIAFIFVKDAVVDHPPRRLPFGSRRAGQHACDIVLSRKWNEPPESLFDHLFREGKLRLKALLWSPISTDSFIALASAGLELSAVAVRYHGWLGKYNSSRIRPHPEAMRESGRYVGYKEQSGRR